MNSKISSLSNLISRLSGASKEEYKSIGVNLEIPLEDFSPFANWSSEHYTRNCIVREDNFELILLCWEPGQGTPIHCHGGEECWVYVIDGKIKESHYEVDSDKLKLIAVEELLSGKKSFMSDDLGYHSLENNPHRRTMSLHLYMDPIDDCTVYDSDTEMFVPRSLSYYSFKGELEAVEV